MPVLGEKRVLNQHHVPLTYHLILTWEAQLWQVMEGQMGKGPGAEAPLIAVCFCCIQHHLDEFGYVA